jgi:hypothetical protein
MVAAERGTGGLTAMYIVQTGAWVAAAEKLCIQDGAGVLVRGDIVGARCQVLDLPVSFLLRKRPVGKLWR